jgi:very-short-patch-repair endonuclease
LKNKILPYNPILKDYAKKLRKQGVLSEVLLWKKIQKKTLGVAFHRQVPIDNFIVDFFCHELMLAIEIDVNSHLNSEVQVNDIKRQAILETLGVKFIRFSDLDVKQKMNDVIRCLQAKVEELKET